MGKPNENKVNEIITICVGGKDFKTTRGTLMSDQNSMLAKMFDSDNMGRTAPASTDENGSYFFDRSPKYFESILNFLRTGEVEASQCLDLRFLMHEAEYYGVEGMAEKIRKELQNKQAYENHMREHCEQLNCIQQCCQNYLSQIAEYTSRQAQAPAFPLAYINSNFQNHHHHGHHHFGHFGHNHHHHH